MAILVPTLHAIAFLWFLIGTLFTVATRHDLYSPAKEADRQEWRRQTMDRAHADANTDFFTTNLSFFIVFFVVLIGWPFFLKRALG